jgi:hypothetical protein
LWIKISDVLCRAGCYPAKSWHSFNKEKIMAQSLAELLASARGLTAALKLKTSALDAGVTDLQSWQSEAQRRQTGLPRTA